LSKVIIGETLLEVIGWNIEISLVRQCASSEQYASFTKKVFLRRNALLMIAQARERLYRGSVVAAFNINES